MAKETPKKDDLELKDEDAAEVKGGVKKNVHANVHQKVHQKVHTNVHGTIKKGPDVHST